MTLWARVRDEVLRRTHQLGRQVALELVSALQRVLANEGRVFVLGPWRQVWGALGLPAPSGKAARAALKMLAAATTAVVHVTSHTWRVVSHAADVATAEQLELLLDDDPNGKGESGPMLEQQLAAKPPAPSAPRTLARSTALEAAWGPGPRSVAAQVLAARVDELGAVEAGRAWAVTLTAPDGADVEAAARAFASRLVDGSGAALTPERSPSGRVHFHGLAIGTEAEVAAALLWSGAGSTDVSEIRGLRRLRYWAGYALKGPAEDLDPITTGVLAAEPLEEAEGSDGKPNEVTERSVLRSARPGVLARAWARAKAAWKRWRGRKR